MEQLLSVSHRVASCEVSFCLGDVDRIVSIEEIMGGGTD